MKRILVALDSSPRAQTVLAAAARMAELAHSKLILFRAISVPSDMPREVLNLMDRRLEDVLIGNATPTWSGSPPASGATASSASSRRSRPPGTASAAPPASSTSTSSSSARTATAASIACSAPPPPRSSTTPTATSSSSVPLL